MGFIDHTKGPRWKFETLIFMKAGMFWVQSKLQSWFCQSPELSLYMQIPDRQRRRFAHQWSLRISQATFRNTCHLTSKHACTEYSPYFSPWSSPESRIKPIQTHGGKHYRQRRIRLPTTRRCICMHSTCRLVWSLESRTSCFKKSINSYTLFSYTLYRTEVLWLLVFQLFV